MCKKDGTDKRSLLTTDEKKQAKVHQYVQKGGIGSGGPVNEGEEVILIHLTQTSSLPLGKCVVDA